MELSDVLEKWGVVIASLVPLGGIILFVIKSFQVNQLDWVFMKKERKTAMRMVQCIVVCCMIGCYNCVLINIDDLPKIPKGILIAAFLFYVIIMYTLLVIYYLVAFHYPLVKDKKLFFSPVFDRYVLISFVVLVILSGVILLADADKNNVNDVYLDVLAFSAMKAAYLMFSLKTSEMLSNKKVWVKYKQYPKLYLLYEFDKNTILCEIPPKEDDSCKQRIRISKEDLKNIPLYQDNGRIN